MPHRKVSVQDIATAAGVSTATVDRVMNGRAGVSQLRRRKVLEAARALGATRIPALPEDYRLRVLIVRTAIFDEYHRRLDAALEQVAATSSPPIQLVRVSEVPSPRLSAAIREAASGCHGVIVLTHDGAEVRKALERAGKSQLPIVALTSNVVLRNQGTYVGIDNVAAGRTVGLMMSRFVRRPGRVLLMTGPQSYVVHRDRTRGFVDALGQHAPWLQLIGPVDVGDVDPRSQVAMRQALRGKTPLVGIYNSGGANEGVRRVLEPMAPAERPVWMTHESHVANLALLRSGVMSLIVDQDPLAQATVGLQTILHAHGELAHRPDPLVRFHLVCAENTEGAPSS